jgi:hypothetical protein
MRKSTQLTYPGIVQGPGARRTAATPSLPDRPPPVWPRPIQGSQTGTDPDRGLAGESQPRPSERHTPSGDGRASTLACGDARYTPKNDKNEAM